jgi:hypothetical protein
LRGQASRHAADGPLSFIASVELATLAGARVLHVPAAPPSAHPSRRTVKPYSRVELAAEPIVTYPMFEHPDLDAAFVGPEEDLGAFFGHPVNNDEFHRALDQRRAGPRHWIGGYASPVQGPVESEVAQVAFGGHRPADDTLLQAAGIDPRNEFCDQAARWRPPSLTSTRRVVPAEASTSRCASPAP